MTRRTHGLKILGLSLLAVLGLMAVSAAGAQAEGKFLIEGQDVSTLPGGTELVTGTGGPGKLLVPGLALTIECTSADIDGTLEAKGMALAKVLFLGCVVAGNKFCKVYPTEGDRNAKTNPGDLTAVGLGLLVLMGGKHYLLVEQEKESPAFTTVWFSKSGEGCALTSGEPITGSTVFEIEEPALTNQLEHSILTLTEAQINALFPTDLLSYGNQRAWLHDSLATVHLAGADEGKKWSVE